MTLSRALRLPWRRRRPAPAPPPRYGDDGLVLLVAADDPARADSAVLAELAAAGVALDGPLVVAHLVVGVAARPLADGLGDGYAIDQRMDGEGLAVHRAELLTARGLAQERTRMAGLAQRLGGRTEGYQVWAVARAAPGTTGTTGSTGAAG